MHIRHTLISARVLISILDSQNLDGRVPDLRKPAVLVSDPDVPEAERDQRVLQPLPVKFVVPAVRFAAHVPQLLDVAVGQDLTQPVCRFDSLVSDRVEHFSPFYTASAASRTLSASISARLILLSSPMIKSSFSRLTATDEPVTIFNSLRSWRS